MGRRLVWWVVIALTAVPAFAQVPDAVYDTLIGETVELLLDDQSRVSGILLSADAVDAVIELATGFIRAVPRREVEAIRRIRPEPVADAQPEESQPAAPAAPAEPAEQPESPQPKPEIARAPFPESWWQVDPLGLLQFGPAASYHYRVTPTGAIGGGVRWFGLGLLGRLIFEGVGGSTPSVLSGGPEAWYTVLLPTRHPTNLAYVRGRLGLWVVPYTGDDSSGEFEGRTIIFPIGVSGGYRWRYESGFYVQFGGFVAVAPTSSRYEYTDGEPSGSFDESDTFFAAGLELTLGNEN